MNLVVIGTNHKYSPIQIRERLSFSKGKVKDVLSNLVSYGWIKAAVILSTCNRVELYASTPDPEMAIKTLKAFLSDYHHQDLLNIEPYLYTYIDKKATLHLFNVAGGLDSQILGEVQILEQVRFAYKEAKTVEATDELLDRVFDKAIETGIRVRNKTKISSEGDISLGSLSINLIKKRLGVLKDKKVLIIGVGKISESVIKYLRNEELKATFISNRTYERAFELARFLKDTQVLGFDSLKEKLKEVDIIISATSSPHLILKKEDLVDVKKPVLIIDLAVPRDVDPQLKHIKDISLFCLDDLDSVLKENLGKRRQEIPKAQNIIQEAVEKLWTEEPLKLAPV